VHDVLTADVQNRYLITYTLTNQQVDGAWRGRGQHDGSHPRHPTRPGHFAPKPRRSARDRIHRNGLEERY
jgi:hypothetical protein